ncbi:MAG: hypothetical protein CUN55_14320, partial [Phototrophicales bacterium]
KDAGEMYELYRVVVDREGRPHLRKHYSFSRHMMDGETPDEAVDNFMCALKMSTINEGKNDAEQGTS